MSYCFVDINHYICVQIIYNRNNERFKSTQSGFGREKAHQ